MPIKILPPSVADKIAAGEVIERPASVVKELIENAVDAGASAIKVEIIAGGKERIKITDNGIGIPTDEVSLAFQRHATSKLSTIEDLFQVKTLGFRGEALASVAAVSQLSMLTRPAAQTSGIRIQINGGEIQSSEPVGTPVGTTITIDNLFFNVPARLKFLKAHATETGHVHKVVSHYAMAYPEIQFSLISNGRQVFQTDGRGNLFDVLVSVWKLETARQMVEVQATFDDGITVSGYVGTPALHRGQRDQLIFFVNRRWIQDRSLAHAVAQAYHTFLPIGRHPVAVLNIEMPTEAVDVNVHPTKAEVKFQNPSAIFGAVQRPVRAAVLQDAPMIRDAQSLSGHGETWSHGGHAGDFIPTHHSPQASQFGFEIQRTSPTEQAFTIDSNAPGTEEKGIPFLRVVGQIQQMYIIAEGPDGLYLIDQHAAHERILYEKMMAQHATAAVISQQLLSPVLLELTPGQSAIVDSELETLLALGFQIEPFGGHSYRLLAMPEILAKENPESAFIDLLADMADGSVPLAKETHERIALIVCKRASIKGGQSLSEKEIRELIHLLEATQNPRTCPHGRPTMIHMSAYQLAKEFGRH